MSEPVHISEPLKTYKGNNANEEQKNNCPTIPLYFTQRVSRKMGLLTAKR